MIFSQMMFEIIIFCSLRFMRWVLQFDVSRHLILTENHAVNFASSKFLRKRGHVIQLSTNLSGTTSGKKFKLRFYK